MQNYKNLVTSVLVLVMLSLFLNAQPATRGAVPIRIDTGKGEVDLYAGSYALIIGISDYSEGWPDLESIPAEIADTRATLETIGFEVVSHLNPTAKELKAGFEQFINNYGYHPQNRLLIYFSGHGYSRGVDKGYLVPADAPLPEKDLTGFLKKALTMTQIIAWSRQMEAKHVLYLFDSCFSGTIFKTRALPEVPPLINAAAAKPVRQFITAGSAGEEVPAKSVFAPMFNRGIRNGEADLNGDEYITGTELGLYLREKVLDYPIGQTPQYGKIKDPSLDEGDFVFLSLKNSPVGQDAPELLSPIPEASDSAKHSRMEKQRLAVLDSLQRLATETNPISRIDLRDKPNPSLPDLAVRRMVQKLGFYDRNLNPDTAGFHNDFQLQKAGKVVLDRSSGLMWERSLSTGVTHDKGHYHPIELNRNAFAGYRDWRLPTLEEALTLMEKTKQNGLYINTEFFGSDSKWFWTSDMARPTSAWYVNFRTGTCSITHIDQRYPVRAVRTVTAME